ncbi:MAG: class I SAM-dependent methyltransferase [Candidatus Omnitrophica bacterium]|nr:class I SAM-dependent methyltransferase [Candidatus Omnitrophota bacterium]
MDPILIQAISKYKKHKLLYLFAFLRSWHADYELIEKYCPAEGSLIDVGCGYGIFAHYLAMKSSRRSVFGVEINEHKLALAPRDLPNVTFSNQTLSSFREESVDAVIFYGMLHHVDGYHAQEELLRDALRILKPSGRFVVIDIDNKPLWKFLICWLVDHTLYFGDRIYFRFKKDMMQLLEKQLGLNVKTFMCDSKAPLPHIAYIASPQPLAAVRTDE